MKQFATKKLLELVIFISLTKVIIISLLRARLRGQGISLSIRKVYIFSRQIALLVAEISRWSILGA